MKGALIFLMLVVILPFSYASIEIVNELEKKYNLGDEISFSVKILSERTDTVLVKSTLKCTEREIHYYIAPIELKKAQEIKVDVAPIKAFSEGLCNIRVNVESLEGENLEGITSREFIVSSLLELSVTVDKTDLLPGDKIKIGGSVSKNGKKIEEGSIVVRLGNKKEQIELDGKDFSYELILDKDIKSGEHTIVVEVNDSYGNHNEEGIKINVEAVPTTLDFIVNGNEFMPIDTLAFKVELLDQADEVIKKKVNVRLFRGKTLFKDEIVIFDEEIEANKEYGFKFIYNTSPNDYILKASFGDLENEDTITILPYHKIEMKLVGDVVFIKNIGNVKFNNETTILLEREDKKYIINKKIRLDVGEETTIDLSEEVGSGNYRVTLPPETVREEKINEKTVERVIEVPKYINKDIDKEGEGGIDVMKIGKTVGLKAGNVIENVNIGEDRSLYMEGIDWVGGMVVASTGLLLKRPNMASLIIIVVLLSLFGYFNRSRIKNIIKKIGERRSEKL